MPSNLLLPVVVPICPLRLLHSIHAWTGLEFVANEEGIRTYATVMLHKPVEGILGKFGMNGEFELSAGGNRAIVGSPDFSWIASPEQPHPKLIVRVLATSSLLVKLNPAGVG